MSIFETRRKSVLESIDGVMLLPSAPVAIRNNDVEHAYRQDSDLYYLTGFDEPECALLLSTVHPKHRSVLFVRPRDPEREVWDGSRAGLEGAKQRYGADEAYPIEELPGRLKTYLSGADKLFYKLGIQRDLDETVLAAIEASRARGRATEPFPTSIVDPAVVLHPRRLRKEPSEIDSMRKAAAITADAHIAAMAAAKPGDFEYHVEAVLLQEFRKGGSERPAYGPIVGAGPNATVLHYRANNRRMQDGEVLLIDAGCEYDYYACDVTRTFPVNGTFSDAQKRVYDVVLASQVAAIEAVKPGASIDSVHEAALRELVVGMVRIGLLEGEVDKIIEDQSYRRYFMHRTSHWLGMDVHDVGHYYKDGKPLPFEPGMVITVEPGIYIAAGDEQAPEPLRGIGVRIEDDILVTPGGYEDLTRAIPKEIAAVEQACRA